MAEHSEAVDELLGLLDEQHPDPVDVIEGRLAEEMWLVRHPSMSQPEWRRVRVAAINVAHGQRREKFDEIAPRTTILFRCCGLPFNTCFLYRFLVFSLDVPPELERGHP